MRTVLILVLALVPAFAQIDLSGEWNPVFHEDQPERIPGPEIGDYLGLPITDAARMRGDVWDAEILTLPEHQCKPHPADYGPRGPFNLRIWKEVDTPTQQIIAWHTHGSWQAPERTVYMDGRPHPPEYAAHTWQGFSTGKWDGDILTITTTHLKTGWIRRNGIPRSDRATLTEHWIRHGDHLTWVSIVNDPVYLTEPFIRSTDFALDPHQQIDPYPCESVTEVPRAKGEVPSFLPGTNPFLQEFATKHAIPEQAARGGAETMYPHGGAPAPSNRPVQVPSLMDDGEIHILPVQGNVYMLVGGGGNTTVQVGKDGILIVDTKLSAQSDKLDPLHRQHQCGCGSYRRKRKTCGRRPHHHWGQRGWVQCGFSRDHDRVRKGGCADARSRRAARGLAAGYLLRRRQGPVREWRSGPSLASARGAQRWR
jgi:hypothetical protein